MEEFRVRESDGVFIKICKKFKPMNCDSDVGRRLMRIFGLSSDELVSKNPEHELELFLRRGEVVYITGPSGSGKSVLLKEILEMLPEEETVLLDDIVLSGRDCAVATFGDSVIRGISSLCDGGLSDVFSMLQRPALLSEGQKYRYRLSKAMHERKRFVVADEFCSCLDRVMARSVAYSVRKYAKEYDCCFVLASCHDDLLADLRPDHIVVKKFNGKSSVVSKMVVAGGVK